ncbi:hypothetical protein [Altererythrobacter ishigakiensis]|jgi:hypothetical protein|uniref:Uncharacterized protein n=1 Tax=Altererythrobacter ishigakiensis TaxID=476157 RepID=A0A562US51_9SPHN|nr:hypothetical protein [Altererythrobacter ishigakiensis]MDX1703850.1 hypothetical protein [Altererythrobacter ishigakiensis]TWJ08431.1 hypothetical protein JN10_0041 [Altererythrobacter ishigakiensis]
MNDTYSSHETASAGKREYAHDWRKKMSDHVAYALLVYTGLQIFATMGAMKETGMKMLALFALVVLVGAIIPACRKFERRWRNLTDEQAADMSYESAFKRDLTMLWLLAIGLPFALTMLFKGIAALM